MLYGCIHFLPDSSPCLIDTMTPRRSNTTYSLMSISSTRQPTPGSSNLPKQYKGSRQLRRVRAKINQESCTPQTDSGDDTATGRRRGATKHIMYIRYRYYTLKYELYDQLFSGSVSETDSDSAMGPEISQTEETSSMSLSLSNDHHRLIVEGNNVNLLREN